MSIVNTCSLPQRPPVQTLPRSEVLISPVFELSLPKGKCGVVRSRLLGRCFLLSLPAPQYKPSIYHPWPSQSSHDDCQYLPDHTHHICLLKYLSVPSQTTHTGQLSEIRNCLRKKFTLSGAHGTVIAKLTQGIFSGTLGICALWPSGGQACTNRCHFRTQGTELG